MGDCIYGPVPSRRLGRSLGLDLLPAKICTYNCIYCQLGQSSAKTVKRRAYRDAEEILAQLDRWLTDNPRPDCITLAGSGEPTLNSDIGRVIAEAKTLSDLPVVVLTNGSLLSDPAVREALLTADIVIPSLDAHNREMFETINRPHRSIDFDRMTGGIAAFRREFSGRLWLEIFIMEGINGSPADAEAFRPLVDKIDPDTVYVNTAVRPPAEDYVRPVSAEGITVFHRLLDKQPQQDITFTGPQADKPAGGDPAARVCALIARRPVTRDDIAAGLGIAVDQADAAVEKLLAGRRIEGVEKNGRRYFRLRETKPADRNK